MKFRIRKSTNILQIHLKDTQGKTAQELQREAILDGQLSLGYHYVVLKDGLVEQGREPYAVAGCDLAGRIMENPDNSICVLVDARMGRMTDAQRVSLADLKASIGAEYPNIKIITEK